MKFGIVWGTFYEYAGFSTRYHEHDEITLPDKIEGVSDEERQKMLDDRDCDKIARTSDGKYFVNLEAAKAHEASLDLKEVNEVAELLEKAKILAEASKDKYPVLATVAATLSEINGDGGMEMLDTYYDSTCW